ncbi:MAG: efflux RND transporter permease subunit [Bacteroidales bacterium]|nr:efflux RND transporter permease subunit [Bacteroidales bacterium]
MIGKLIERPIAVTMSIIAVVVLGLVAVSMLPVSLMPDVEIPQVTVQISAPGYSAREVDKTIVKSLSSQLMQTQHLKELRCESKDNGADIFMEFDHGTDIDFTFIEVNEKVDKAISSMPKEIERPKVIKANATDIPAFFINMTASEDYSEKFLELSRFASEVISKRLEQVPEIALVDISGLSLPEIIVTPKNEKMRALGIMEKSLKNAIENSNLQLGNLSIKDGHYRWDIRFISEIRTREEIENIVLNIDGRIYKFKDLATVTEQAKEVRGLVRSDGKRAISLAIIKQSDAKMDDLKKAINKSLTEFEKEYPGIEFKVTRDQTELLSYSIGNLKNNLIIGAILACIVLFLFMKDFRSPWLVTITIPLSLIVALLFFFLVGISINIISLSGLILGIGMMVDNSIVVIDNITQLRERGFTLKEAVVKGVNEVFSAMLSSVLTTCSVFIPLVFLSGIAGALFYDQALGVSIGLLSSLLVAVLVIPVYYYQLYKKRGESKENKILGKLRLIDIVALYEKGLKWTFRHQRIAWILFLLTIPGAYVIYNVIDKSKLPPVTHDDIMVSIDWNFPITTEESDRRTLEVLKAAGNNVVQSSAFVGNQQFLLSHTPDLGQSEALLYLKADKPSSLPDIEKRVADLLKERYPDAAYRLSQTDNIFNLVFSDKDYNLTARIMAKEGGAPDPDKLNNFLSKISDTLPSLYMEPVLWQEQIMFVADPEMLSIYKISYSDVYNALKTATMENTVFAINEGSYSVPVTVGEASDPTTDLLMTTVINEDGIEIPLSVVTHETRIRDLKSIISGTLGDYYPLNLTIPDKDVKESMSTIKSIANRDKDFDVTFSGSYFSNREMIGELAIILTVALLLLFFILAAQFESLIQPLIILSEIVVDVFAAMLLLWACGSGINLMSMIGLVVMAGIIINDSILKVDTINRLRKGGYSLLRAIMTGGSRRLKPIIMTSLTTVLAIAPFLVRGDIGSDLQYPLSLALIGGMVMGTIVSVFFIPVFYYNIYNKRKG